MDYDTIFILGTFVIALGIPAIVAAFANSRPPRIGAILILLGGVAVVYAMSKNPGAYTVSGYPDLLFEVIAKFLN